MSRMIRKKRSLKGKLLLGLIYIFLCSIIIVVLRPIMLQLSGKNAKESANQDNNVFEKIYEKPSKIESVNYDEVYAKEQRLVCSLIRLVKKVGYKENGIWNINKNGEIVTDGIDSFGLVELSYYFANEKYLKDLDVGRSDILNYTRVNKDNLKIGDIGICLLADEVIYGVYVGDYAGNPLFVYACSLEDDNNPGGSIYLSYDKNIYNEVFAGMFPIPFDFYVRLPGMDLKSMSDLNIVDVLPKEIIPSQDYGLYASAVYRIGEWLCSQDTESLIGRLNKDALERNGLYLDDELYKEYIYNYNSSIGYDNYFFKINGCTRYDEYVIVSAEIINNAFKSTGINFIGTIYGDGTYLPAPEVQIQKYALICGFRPIRNDLDTENIMLVNDELRDNRKSIYEDYGFIIGPSESLNDN